MKIGDLVKLKPTVENDGFFGVGPGLICDVQETLPEYESYFEVQFSDDRCWFRPHELILLLASEIDP